MAKPDAKALNRNLGKWPGGIDEISDPRGLQAREVPALRDAVNVDIRNDGRIRRRTGRTLVREGRCHSGWAPRAGDFALFVSAGVLYRMELLSGEERITALGQLGSDSPVSYTEQAGRIYASNARARFVLDPNGDAPQPWGVEEPIGVPMLAAVEGFGLPAGQYQVATTFMSVSGEESGTGAAAAIQLAEGQGIAVSGMPQPAGAQVALIRLYLSTTNGANGLRWVRDVLPGTAAVTLDANDLKQLGKALDTQHCQRVPFCTHVSAYRGRIFFVPAREPRKLAYTEVLRYGLTKPHEHYLPLPEDITGVLSLADGLYVGTTDAVYWFSGTEPKEMGRTLVQRFGMVPGTGKVLRGTIFGAELAQGEVAAWWNTKGELIRAAGGLNLNAMTRGRIAVPHYAKGAIEAREFNGVSQIVSSLHWRSHDSGFATTDRAEATVYRHGVAV